MQNPETSVGPERIIEIVDVFGTSEVAYKLGLSPRTIERWMKESSKIPAHVNLALDQVFGKKFFFDADNQARPGELTFIDLFAGIGGIRRGLESAGAKCVFTSEWDKYAAKTYSQNFESGHQIAGDITRVSLKSIPQHDVLAAGFPCQPFSLAGVSKKNALGRNHGFLDETQGTLFFNVAEIIAEKRPRAFLLENVKNLLSHDKGNTFRVIKRVLEEDLGYVIHFKVIDAKPFVPQHRERIYIIGFRDGQDFDWDLVKPVDTAKPTKLQSILHAEDGSEDLRPHDENKYIDHATGLVLEKYTLSDGLWSYLQAYAAKHKAAGNGFGFGLVTPEMTSRTLSARYYKDGSEILVSQGPDKNPRKLTPRECARLMGFPDTFTIPVSDTQAYRQFGNSVAVPVVSSIAIQIVSALK